MSCRIRWIHKKNIFKFLSIVLVAAIIIGFQVGMNLKTKAAERTEPSFSISDLKYTPENPIVGEDITVTGKIIPNDFVTSVPENDIVLVLDVSGSMERDYPYVNHHIEVKTVYRSFLFYDYEYYCYDCGKYVDKNHRNEYVENGKLKELKKAANNFIDKMKSVPNVKIGIVAYSDYAWVNPNGFWGYSRTRSLDVSSYHDVPDYNLQGDFLLDSTDRRLSQMVNGLSALGGTNTGEGMRKGLKLLETGNKSAKKTMVLMSDGLPTFYSVKDRGYDYYTQENFSYPDYRGTGNSDEDEKCLNYATTIGDKIKQNSFNAFTIGYGLDDDGNKKLKKIHESMVGEEFSENSKSYEENGFFATSTGAIDSVFNIIGNKILDEYSVDDGFFHDEMVDGFELAIGSEKVSIPSMKYKKVGEVKNGKVTYHCEPYEFSIVIKGGKSGEFENIFDRAYISFSWQDKTIRTSMLDMGISIDDNKLPNIRAELISEQKVRLDPNASSSVTYKINAESFQYEDTANQSFKKDVIILVDTSSGMDSQKLNQFKNGVFNKLLSDNTLRATTKYCVITYNSTATIKNPDNEQNYQNYKDVEGETENLKQNPNRINDLVIKNLAISEISNRNIGDALEKAADVFNEDKDKSDRYLLLVSSGNVEYTSQNIEDFKKKVDNFEVLSLAIGSNNDNSNPDTFLYNVHKDLSGEESAQLVSNNTEGKYFVSSGKENNNDINNTIMSQIAEKIKSNGQKRNYEFNVSLKFNLGNDIDLISGLTSSNGNYYTANTKVVYKYNSITKEYEAEPTNDIAFEVKPNKIGQKCKFGSDNTISYNGITDFIERNIGKTPEFIIESENIQHGIYQGREYSGSYNLDESNNHTYYKGSMATMGIKAEVYGTEPLTLTIGNNATIQDKIRIYNTETGQLINTINTSSDSRSYSIPITDIISEDKKNIFILYTVKINNNASGKLTNRVTTYNGTYKDAEINIGGELPDLF
ncbi:VWA domain-containing protein [Clostridium sp. SM-530-WT-3G]|uniref:vWA domain-containing protein n=1 Tax=Clostridium sp. SM-530-WT-3G TaxID=2725303 RepID=UPI00145E8F39|nr:VWA domain-containing protein [Clostridium sp. SM-530-WT-3G]NME83044.1 VWA domain-containing protein [Clostridium sp. SM-530-WT-3G]